jgi:hypothetical protein
MSIFERRVDGAVAAPDSVQVYLAKSGATPKRGDKPIFEGQDVGRICYFWYRVGGLIINISGGYVDSVSSYRPEKSGMEVKVTFDPHLDCEWKRSYIRDGAIYYDERLTNHGK